MRRLASMVNWAKTVALTRLDIRKHNGSSVEDTNCHGHFWVRSKVANWHRWSCQITRLSSVDESHVCGCMTCLRNHGHESPCETRVVGRGSSEFTHPGIMTGELVFVCRKVKKTEPTREQHLLPICSVVQPLLLAKRKNNVFVSSRGRVTKVAPECLQKASVAEQMSWDITTKKTALFEGRTLAR